MSKATKKPDELKDAELDRVQGGGTKELAGDDTGFPKQGNEITPQNAGWKIEEGEGIK